MTDSPNQDPLSERIWRVDFLAGIVVGVVALAVWLQSYDLSMGEISNFGPGFLPKVLGGALAVGAIALVIWGLVQPPSRAERVHMAWRGPAMVAIGVAFFAFFVRGWHLGPIPTPQLGLAFVGPITVILAGFGTKEANIKELIVLGFGLTALTTMLFADILSLQFPIFPRFMQDAMINTIGFEWPKRICYVSYAVICVVLFKHFGFKFSDENTETGDAK